jgi:phage shock protein A
LPIIVGTLLLAGCGESEEGEKAVVHVGDVTITREQLDETVEHFREEREREGKQFPEEDDPDFKQVERQLLGLLVYRAELEQEAERLGVDVEEEELEERLDQAGGEEGEKEGEEAFARDSVRAQLQLEGIARALTRGIDDAAERNARLRRFLTQMRQRYADEIRYEPR